VGEHAPGVVLELVPLLEEVVAAVVADFEDGLAVGDADFADVRRVDDEFAASARTGSSLYMHLPRSTARHTSPARRRGWS